MQQTASRSPHLFQWTSNSFNAVDSFRKGRFTEGSCLDTTLKVASVVYKALFICTAMWAITVALDIFVRLPIRLCKSREQEYIELRGALIAEALKIFGEVPKDLDKLPAYLERSEERLTSKLDDLAGFGHLLLTSFAKINPKRENAIQRHEKTQRALKSLLNAFRLKQLHVSYSSQNYGLKWGVDNKLFLFYPSLQLSDIYEELKYRYHPPTTLIWPSDLSSITLVRTCEDESLDTPFNSLLKSSALPLMASVQESEIEEDEEAKQNQAPDKFIEEQRVPYAMGLELRAKYVGKEIEDNKKDIIDMNDTLDRVAKKLTQTFGVKQVPHSEDAAKYGKEDRCMVNVHLFSLINKIRRTYKEIRNLLIVEKNIFETALDQQIPEARQIRKKLKILKLFRKSHRKPLVAPKV